MDASLGTEAVPTAAPACNLDGNWHYQFRIILLGDSTVGKTSLLRSYTERCFLPDPCPTVGVEFYSKIIELPPGIKVKLQLWDTAGQERFRPGWREGTGGGELYHRTSRECRGQSRPSQPKVYEAYRKLVTSEKKHPGLFRPMKRIRGIIMEVAAKKLTRGWRLQKFVSKTAKSKSTHRDKPLKMPVTGASETSACGTRRFLEFVLMDKRELNPDSHKSITRSFYRNAVGVILVFDMTNRRSFENIFEWHNEVTTAQTMEKVIFLLIGHKSDLQSESRVSIEEAEGMATCLGTRFIGTSAKDNMNVDLAFDMMTNAIYEALRNKEIDLQEGWDGIKVIHKKPISSRQRRRRKKPEEKCQC